MKHFLLFFLLLLSLLTENKLVSQNHSIDSLKLLIDSHAVEDTTRVNTLLELGYQYIMLGDYKNSILKAQEAYQTASKIKFTKGEANSLGCLANNYISQGDYVKALENYTNSLKIFEGLGDKNKINRNLGNIGNLYYTQKEYQKALGYYQKALAGAEKQKDNYTILSLLVNIGNIYNEIYMYDKALDYYLKSIPYCGPVEKLQKAIIMGNIGQVYRMQKEYTKALDYYFEALKLREALKDKKGISLNMGNIGDVYIILGKYKEAEKYLVKAMAIASEIEDLDDEMYLNASLSELYEKKKDWKQAFIFSQKYTTIKDSLFNEAKSKQLAEIQTKYEVKEKEKKLELIRSERELEKYRNYVIFGLITVIGITALLLINRQRIKIKREKERAEIKGKLAHAEIARNKLEKENLETSLLLNQEKLNKITSLFRERSKLMDKMQEQLDEVKNKTTNDSDVKQLLTSIEEYIDPNHYWEEFITSFNLVHKNFFELLTKKFPELTRSELRLCALIKCDLGNKEIANILNITPDSAKKSRTRLRKKLQLEADDSITKFMLNFN